MTYSNKIIIISGTSGSGKTTLVNYLLTQVELNLSFSISACSRKKRKIEEHGKEYVFLSESEFRQKIQMNHFLEWEEVYPKHFYGTLKSSCEEMLKSGKHILFDVDVKGALSIKNHFNKKARTIFVKPSSIDLAKTRLINRDTESMQALFYRTQKMEHEIEFSNQMDYQLINDDLEKAKANLYAYVKSFLLS